MNVRLGHWVCRTVLDSLSDLTIIVMTMNAWMVSTLLMPNDGIVDGEDYEE